MTHPSGTAPHPPVPAAPPPPPPARRSAWAEGVDRLRTAAMTEPGRLRIIGAVVAALVVAFGAATAWQISDRVAAADDVVSRSQPLSADAASIYRSLADADTAAASGFLAGGQEPHELRERYRKDIANASRLLVKAAASSDGSGDSGKQIAQLNEQLPVYTSLIEQARANNRQGFPVGGAYLRRANEKMSTELLPAAKDLYEAETERLYQDYDDANSWPFIALGVGVLALGGLVWAQRRNYRRTNRVFNHGLVAATAASTVVLLWLAVGHTVARSGLHESQAQGQESLKVLNDARISSLQARANENLTLVARGAVLAEDGKSDKYDEEHNSAMKTLTSGLAQAKDIADDGEGREPVAEALAGMTEWKKRHTAARDTDNKGDYDGALEQIIGAKNSTGECFDKVDASLEKALAHEQREFKQAAENGRGAMTGLSLGAAVLAVLGAMAGVLGIGRRLSEYR